VQHLRGIWDDSSVDKGLGERTTISNKGITSKNTLSEPDICAKYITPAVIQAGWDEVLQIRREVFFTKDRIIVRGKAKRADYPRKACSGTVIVAVNMRRLVIVNY
jgi:hypothetical protein